MRTVSLILTIDPQPGTVTDPSSTPRFFLMLSLQKRNVRLQTCSSEKKKIATNNKALCITDSSSVSLQNGGRVIRSDLTTKKEHVVFELFSVCAIGDPAYDPAAFNERPWERQAQPSLGGWSRPPARALAAAALPGCRAGATESELLVYKWL